MAISPTISNNYPSYSIVSWITLNPGSPSKTRQDKRYSYSTKEIYTANFVSGINYGNNSIPNGSLIDIYQDGNNIVFVTKVSAPSFIQKNIISNSTLLYYYSTPASPIKSISYSYFNKGTNTKIDGIYYSNYFFLPNYILPYGTLLKTQCAGYTYKEYYFNLPSVIEVVDTENSTICGYVEIPPEVIGGRLTEIKRVKTVEVNCNNPVMLTWKNTKGGWDYWLFTKTQSINKSTESLGVTKSVYFALEELESQFRDMGKDDVQSKMILGATGLTASEKRGIEVVLMSNLVYELNQNGTIKRRVIPSPSSWLSIETGNELHDIEFEIVLPETFTIKN